MESSPNSSALLSRLPAAGELAHHHPHLVAHRGGVDVLVGGLVPAHGRHVDAALVREGGLAHVGQVLVGREVRHLGHEVRHLGERPQPARRAGSGWPSFSSSPAATRAEVGVAAALAIAVDGALHLRPRPRGRRPASWPPRSRRRRGRGCRAARRPPSRTAGPPPATCQGSDPPLVSHSTSVSAPPRRGRAERRQRVARVGPVAVEEVLGVVDDPATLGPEVGEARLDDAQVLVEGGAKHLGDVQRSRSSPPPCTPAHRIRGAPGCWRRPPGSPPARQVEPKAAISAPLPGQVAGPGEELRVLGVGAWPAALDEGHAQLVQAAGDAELVVRGERDALPLRPVA